MQFFNFKFACGSFFLNPGCDANGLDKKNHLFPIHRNWKPSRYFSKNRQLTLINYWEKQLKNKITISVRVAKRKQPNAVTFDLLVNFNLLFYSGKLDSNILIVARDLH